MAKKTTAENRPDEAQIAAWKEKYSVLHQIESEDGGHICIVRKPRLADLERALKADKQPKARAMDYNRSILANCTLYIDPDYRSDDDRELGLLTSVGDITAIAEATVKKL